MKIAHLDTGFAVAILVLGAWIIYKAVGYGVLGPYVTGSGFFPLLVGSVLVICAIGQLATARSRDESGGEVLSVSQISPMLGISFVMVVFILLLPFAGMVFLTPPFVAAIAYVIERPSTFRGHAVIWLLAIITTVAFYLLFDRALNVPLPWGVFED